MTQPESAAAAPAPGTYRLDPERSTVHTHVKAMFGLLTVHGTFRLLSGEVTVAPDPAQSSVKVAIDTASYASGNATRDKDVTSEALLHAKEHPQITFDGSQVRPDGTGWVVSGSVTAHGSSVPAELRVQEARVEDGAVHFRATADLDRTAFGVTKKKGAVGRAVAVSIDAVGIPT
jgi:polyisoprenoid-binding protein YceI